MVQQHLESFYAQVEAETGKALPVFIQQEFDAFLECGILAHGFLRARCGECFAEKLVAFSCKRRGFCPSCGVRRMADTAHHLVEAVIPRVPVRQWVLSFPMPLRFLLASQPDLLGPVLVVLHRLVTSYLRKKAGVTRAQAKTGAVSLIQRFGGSLNLNIHFRCLVLDGVYQQSEADGTLEFHAIMPPTTEELSG